MAETGTPWEKYAAPKAGDSSTPAGPWDKYKVTLGPAKREPEGFPYDDPGKTYGSILPFAKDDKTGALEFAVPEMIRAPTRNAITVGKALSGEGPAPGAPMTDDMAEAALTFGMKMPPGANRLGLPGAAGPAKVPRGDVVAPPQMRTDRFAPETGIPQDYDPLTDQHTAIASGNTGGKIKQPGDVYPPQNASPPTGEARLPDTYDPAIGEVKPGTKLVAKRAVDLDYALTPEMTGKTSLPTKLAAGFAGQEKLQFAASAKNQANSNAIAAREIGTDARNPLTPAVYKHVRDQAAAPYGKIAEAVPQLGNLAKDPEWQSALREIKDPKGLAQEFPEWSKNPDIAVLHDMLAAKTEMPTDRALRLVQQLRDEANQNFKVNDGSRIQKHSLAVAERRAADAIEGVIERRVADVEQFERNFSASPRAELKTLVDDYRRARTVLAKSHDLEAATDSQGNVLAARLAQLRATKGRPLSGGLKDIADVFDAFPKAMRNPAQISGKQEFSYLDALSAGVLGGSGHYGVMTGLLGARPLTKSTLLSGPFQRHLTNAPVKNYGMPATAPFAAGAGIAEAIDPPLPMAPDYRQ